MAFFPVTDKREHHEFRRMNLERSTDMQFIGRVSGRKRLLGLDCQSQAGLSAGPVELETRERGDTDEDRFGRCLL